MAQIELETERPLVALTERKRSAAKARAEEMAGAIRAERNRIEVEVVPAVQELKRLQEESRRRLAQIEMDVPTISANAVAAKSRIECARGMVADLAERKSAAASELGKNANVPELKQRVVALRRQAAELEDKIARVELLEMQHSEAVQEEGRSVRQLEAQNKTLQEQEEARVEAQRVFEKSSLELQRVGDPQVGVKQSIDELITFCREEGLDWHFYSGRLH